MVGFSVLLSVLTVLKLSIINDWKTCDLGFMMRITVAAVLFILLAGTLLPLVCADRGGIPIIPGVSIYEPGQKAIVAWNGDEEVLILSTDVSASEQTMVLEILPLPSKPEVGAGSFQSFQQIQEMIWAEAVYRQYFLSSDAARGNSVEVVFHGEIGAHNITVVMADDATALVTWANDFLLSSGVDQNVTLGKFQSEVEDYMSRGFKYYALDLVTVQAEERSMDPIVYSFNCSTLYYPLLITSPVGGGGKITLFLLTENKLENVGYPMNFAYYQTSRTVWRPVQFMLSTGELSKVDLRLSELLPDGAWLTVLTYQGDLGSLTKDVMIAAEDFSQSWNPSTKYIVILPNEMLVLFFILGAVCAFAGAGITWGLITRPSRKK
jgi:hypothetical protein